MNLDISYVIIIHFINTWLEEVCFWGRHRYYSREHQDQTRPHASVERCLWRRELQRAAIENITRIAVYLHHLTQIMELKISNRL